MGKWADKIRRETTETAERPAAIAAERNPTSALTACQTRELTVSLGWTVIFADRVPAEVWTTGTTWRDLLAEYPNATAAEPLRLDIETPARSMTEAEDAAIRRWLALIGETDPDTISDVLKGCTRDIDIRQYFLGRAAAELPKAEK